MFDNLSTTVSTTFRQEFSFWAKFVDRSGTAIETLMPVFIVIRLLKLGKTLNDGFLADPRSFREKVLIGAFVDSSIDFSGLFPSD